MHQAQWGVKDGRTTYAAGNGTAPAHLLPLTAVADAGVAAPL
jgi:hypothetical protein